MTNQYSEEPLTGIEILISKIKECGTLSGFKINQYKTKILVKNMQIKDQLQGRFAKNCSKCAEKQQQQSNWQQFKNYASVVNSNVDSSTDPQAFGFGCVPAYLFSKGIVF